MPDTTLDTARALREDRARIAAILASQLCVGRQQLASSLALRSALPWLKALDVLEADTPATLADGNDPAPEETEAQRRDRILFLGKSSNRRDEAKALAERTSVASREAAVLLGFEVLAPL